MSRRMWSNVAFTVAFFTFALTYHATNWFEVCAAAAVIGSLVVVGIQFRRRMV